MNKFELEMDNQHRLQQGDIRSLSFRERKTSTPDKIKPDEIEILSTAFRPSVSILNKYFYVNQDFNLRLKIKKESIIEKHACDGAEEVMG